jgi:hypothetical protein
MDQPITNAAIAATKNALSTVLLQGKKKIFLEITQDKIRTYNLNSFNVSLNH